MKKLLTLFVFSIFVLNTNAQENKPAKATYTGKSMTMRNVQSLSSRTNLIVAEPTRKEPQDGRSGKNKIVIGKDPQTTNDFFASNPHPQVQKIQGRAPSLVFNVDNNVGPPSDPAIAVGKDHVMMVYNTGFSIYDKTGTEIMGPLNVNNIFSAGGCCDLTISYDNAADRWVMSYLYIGNGIEVAVSDGPDPTTANWNVYSIPQISDYNKLSVWSDGYYVTDNTGATNKVYALERTEMLAGNPSAQIIGFPLPGIVTSNFFSPQALNVTNSNLPAAGGATFVYLQDDAWTGVAQDHLKIWTLNVDWVTPGNSQISAAQTLNTTPFISVFDGGSFSNLQQPGGGSIDALQATIMNQAQFRKFANHNSAVFNFVVDTDASNGELAGVRWFELRQDDDNMPWSIYQEGTYTAPDGRHAWNASLAMDSQGNIGMGYTSMSGPNTPTTVRVSSYYTGRFANDPINTMNIAEEVILNGNGNVNGNRYGDYSKIDVDPNDDKTFWYINEVISNGGKDVVGVFRIAPDTSNDTGVISIDSPIDGLLGSEAVTVTIFNYGNSSQSNIPLNLTVNSTVVATGTFAGPLAPASSAQYTFSPNVDFSTQGQTYIVESCTTLTGDEDANNDCTTTDITHIFHDDIGVIAFTSPNSSTGLGNELITVTIENFGSAVQSNFDVSYTLNGSTETETVPGPLNPGQTISYTFTTQGDFSASGSHNLSATTSLSGDVDTSNDEFSATINNVSCIPVVNNGNNSNETGCNLDGIKQFILGSINVDDGGDGCNTEGGSGIKGYADRTHLSTDLNRLSPIATVRIQFNWTDAPAGAEQLSLWIDFNDNGSWEPSEQLISGATFSAPNVLVTFTMNIPNDAPLGPHILRARVIDTTGNPGDVNDPCANIEFGETHDYTVNIIDPTVSVEDNNLFDENNFIVSTFDNNQFNIEAINADLNDKLNFTVTNMIGQKLLSYNIENVNGSYSYDLDMSYATPGVYILRLGNSKSGNTKKIVVK